MENPLAQVQSINFIDVGCSGSLDDKWSSLFTDLFYVGFDPNAVECERLNNKTHKYKSARYLPYAIAGEQGIKTMYKTENIYCYSLLPPNPKWVNRFSFSHLFKEAGTESVNCTTLDFIAQENNLTADIIKIDTQGLELPILKSAETLLKDVFCLDVETGLVEDYIGETKYSDIDIFLRKRGFLMFDMNIYRISRKNPLSRYGKHQPIWCESMWLFDFIGNNRTVTREQALKYLKICQALEYFDYGYELACHFNRFNVIETELVRYLEKPENWIKGKSLMSKISHTMLGTIPKGITIRLLHKMQKLSHYNRNQ
ncbi:FkbM family methyltransferase [Scytonema sp. UIC 10036]|nr:FkbM family methyltransferase [Scytonema sp. UIC 10036]